ncbi:WXG100 family type VII secretion target [Amycolatopsis sp. CA-230715]|uniref:WXG100 family type VII secretion target n=1 Tax=Amycolatopsis sp. CA-230715 TaxID=2745196 RepID=UPI001C024FD9|nr:hypothetical protein [Amycolatopsis sp. CA-230715]QWF83783.1 hypothetical protein HUW46_07226 [Amycolatopsis sp. CA-230715]
MGQALNTTVNGSSGTCVAAADWLRTVTDAGHHAAGNVRAALTGAEADWQGPASSAFQESIGNIDVVSDQMADWASRTEHGLRDFAASLDTIVARMQDALGKARVGGLQVDGPFIVEPAPLPMGKPGTPVEVCTADNMHKVIGQYKGDINQYNAQVSDYNAKVAIYNECKAIVDGARNTEGEAHQSLLRALAPPSGGPDIDSYKVGTTVIARVNSYISSFENPRKESLLKAARAEGSAQFYENWANGTQLTLTAANKADLKWAIDESRANKVAYETRASEFGKYVEKVPEWVRKTVSAYPGKSVLHVLPAEAGLGLQTGQKLLKGMPYVGSSLTLINEFVGAAKGEQSWGKAAADTAAQVAGGAIGGAAASAGAGALLGAPLGPIGSLVVGTAGGLAGVIGGQAVADWLVPK